MKSFPKIGVLIRVFAVRPKLVKSEADKAMQAVHDLLALNRQFDQPVFHRITLIVPTDQRYVDSDCGPMLDLLRKRTVTLQDNGVVVLRAPLGDISCSVMNQGCYATSKAGCDYTFTLSGTVTSWLNKPVMERMLEATTKGALIVPLAIEPHRRFVLNGRPLGTCTLWHNESLFHVGGFNLMAARPRKAELGPQAGTRWIEDYWPSKQQVVSNIIGGMEEVYPTIQLIRLHYPEPIIAPIDPIGLVQGDWVQPTDPERALREAQKRATKFSRWMQLSTLMDAGPGFCLAGIMEGYRPRREDIDALIEY